MSRLKVIYLIGITYVNDSLNQQIRQESETKVYADLGSVTRAEFSSARLNDLNPDCMVKIWSFEYSGEEYVEMDSVRYHVYRTYRSSGDKIELYLERMPSHGD